MTEWKWIEAIQFGKQYFYISDRVTFEDAKTRCIGLGGQLAQPESKLEEQFIWSLIRNNAKNNIWLGIVNQDIIKEPGHGSGDWRFIDGRPYHNNRYVRT